MFDDSNSYEYAKYIKTPNNVGMSKKGGDLDKNIKGINAYISLLLEGKSKASKTGGPLGNKYFLDTGLTCELDTDSNTEVSRHLFINNKPLGVVPFISNDINKDLRGFIPGTIEKITELDPMSLVTSLTNTDINDKKCKEIEVQVIDVDNNVTTEKNYVAIEDIKEMHPCLFKKSSESKGENPVTREKLECFSTMFKSDCNYAKLPNNNLAKTQNLILTSLGLYIIYLLVINKRVIL